MLNILETIQDWIQDILSACIIDNLTGMFDQLNSEVGEVAGTVGTTPEAWNAGVFSMIRNLSDNVVVPVAGMILAFVLCYELISMIIDRSYYSQPRWNNEPKRRYVKTENYLPAYGGKF